MDDFTGKYVSHSQHQDQQCGDHKDDLFYCSQCVHDFFVDFHALYSSQKFAAVFQNLEQIQGRWSVMVIMCD